MKGILRILMKRNFRTSILTARRSTGPGGSRTEGFKRKIELISSQICLKYITRSLDMFVGRINDVMSKTN